jgi:uncharacterized protein YdhG (YjbR/CyaY superfamily)
MISDADKILALLEAFDILEVFDKLTPNSDAYDLVFRTTLEWIVELGPEKALEKIRYSKEMLKSQINYINNFLR